MTNRTIAILLLLATPALAHLAPIAPSTCGLTMRLVAGGATASVDPPASDLVRVSWEPDASPTRSRAQICPADPADPSTRCGATVPRGFTIGGLTGTIALPSAFGLAMLSSGDLHGVAVPITITAGGPSVAVPFDLDTGVVPVGGTPVLGAPVDASGAVTLVGVGSSAALPPPLGAAPLRLELACTVSPVPDRDQFALAPRLTSVRGALKASKSKLVIVLESELAMAVDASLPAVLRLGVGEAAVVEQVMAVQPAPRGRFVSSDGSLTVIPIKRKTVRAQRVVFRGAIAGTPPFASGNGAMVLSFGGLVARRPVTLKANGKGTRLKVRER